MTCCEHQNYFWQGIVWSFIITEFSHSVLLVLGMPTAVTFVYFIVFTWSLFIPNQTRLVEMSSTWTISGDLIFSLLDTWEASLLYLNVYSLPFLIRVLVVGKQFIFQIPFLFWEGASGFFSDVWSLCMCSRDLKFQVNFVRPWLSWLRVTCVLERPSRFSFWL